MTADTRSAPISTRSKACVRWACATLLASDLAASSAAVFTTLAKSAPLMPDVALANLSTSTSEARGTGFK